MKVSRKYARPLEENEYFIVDLIGCKVYENNLLLGTITDVPQTKVAMTYVTTGGKYGEILIPAVEHVVREVDIENKRVQVVLPEGLIEG